MFRFHAASVFLAILSANCFHARLPIEKELQKTNDLRSFEAPEQVNSFGGICLP